MIQVPQIGGIAVDPEDWANTPASIQTLVMYLLAENQELKDRLSRIEEQLRQNSQNSSKPPSQDGFQKKGFTIKEKSTKNRGGQPGHGGHEMKFYDLSAEDISLEHHPAICSTCGEGLIGNDDAPFRHQILELPLLRPLITEHRLHRLNCAHCGTSTRAKLPERVGASQYGERLTAAIAILSSENDQSHSKVKTLLHRLFGIDISIASVNRLRNEMSNAIKLPVQAAHHYVKGVPVVHSDETSFNQGNADGKNPDRTKGWLWTVVSASVVIFEVALSRAKTVAQGLIGADFSGIVVSDRYRGYEWLDASQRQLCWAHIKRDLTAMTERSGASEEIGTALLGYQKTLFEDWYQVRDGTLSREDFQARVRTLQTLFKGELEEAVGLLGSPKEKSPLAKTLGTCKELLKWESSLWTFADHPGVEPTNNAAEQALRPAVIWRRLSFGSQSEAGSQFVARILTVMTTLNVQGRDVLEFLTLACRASRFGTTMPSLLPQG